ncbi:MAG TPA: Si-specific NAD(P)(+) transhydrogenase [Planctomycetota bacterium]|nr:Si-specific NAD(P)(+) transhydrogenase [Planctomycetota bacterium]
MNERRVCDVAVVGSGPGGHSAAIEAARAGARTILIERDSRVGGECVHRGTIPSKTLHERAQALLRTGGVKPGERVPIDRLMRRKDEVVARNEELVAAHVASSGAEVVFGHARFLSPRELEVRAPGKPSLVIDAANIVLATGSRPRQPGDLPLDHEHVLDSDSVLAMTWLPESIAVFGGGVIASEFASIFAALGSRVTWIDRTPRPLGFLDQEIVDTFLASFRAMGGTWCGGRQVREMRWDGVSRVVTVLDDGSRVEAEQALVALGRVANVERLQLSAAGLVTNARGHLEVNADLQTAVRWIYAVGDVIGPPALAASSMDQGRRAVRHLLGLETHRGIDATPSGIYALPEMACVGVDEATAKKTLGGALVGVADFCDLARGRINGVREGKLKLVADPLGRRLLGAQIVGEGATELVHVAQMALIGKLDVDAFVDHVFNFPTFAEAYRLAALEIVAARSKLLRASA